MTPAERLLWQKLRADQLGVSFRRQHALGPFIVDFCSTEKNLVIEIDGDTHAGDVAQMRDENRSAYLQKSGWTVLRYQNRDVMNSLDSVLEDILKHLE